MKGLRNLRIWTLLIFLLMVGCASNVVIQQGGYPVPEESGILHNEMTGITCYFNLVRIFKESEESSYPNYFKLHELNEAPFNKTEKIILNLCVDNIKKVEYELVKVVRIMPAKTMPIVIRKAVYKGKKERKVFQLTCPIISDTVVEVTAEIRYKGKPILFVGPFTYYLEKKVSCEDELDK